MKLGVKKFIAIILNIVHLWIWTLFYKITDLKFLNEWYSFSLTMTVLFCIIIGIVATALYCE